MLTGELDGHVHETMVDEPDEDPLMLSDRRLEANDPLLTVPITSELGNVSPVAIVPDHCTDDELWFMARNVATSASAKDATPAPTATSISAVASTGQPLRPAIGANNTVTIANKTSPINGASLLFDIGSRPRSAAG